MSQKKFRNKLRRRLASELHSVVEPADRAAVEAHILEVACWERAQIAREIALVRQEAERRYQAAVWNGYHLLKVGNSWVRAPVEENRLKGVPNAQVVALDPPPCAPEHPIAISSDPAAEDQIPARRKTSRVLEAASAAGGGHKEPDIERRPSQDPAQD